MLFALYCQFFMFYDTYDKLYILTGRRRNLGPYSGGDYKQSHCQRAMTNQQQQMQSLLQFILPCFSTYVKLYIPYITSHMRGSRLLRYYGSNRKHAFISVIYYIIYYFILLCLFLISNATSVSDVWYFFVDYHRRPTA